MDAQDKERMKQAEENEKLREQLQSFLNQYEVLHTAGPAPSNRSKQVLTSRCAGPGKALRATIEAKGFGGSGTFALTANLRWSLGAVGRVF
eukprot:276500-Rhodomonas_salina.1